MYIVTEKLAPAELDHVDGMDEYAYEMADEIALFGFLRDIIEGLDDGGFIQIRKANYLDTRTQGMVISGAMTGRMYHDKSFIEEVDRPRFRVIEGGLGRGDCDLYIRVDWRAVRRLLGHQDGSYPVVHVAIQVDRALDTASQVLYPGTCRWLLGTHQA